MKDLETIVVERKGCWLYVTLNRPAVRNAMNRKMVDELDQVFQEIEPDRSLRAVILRGAGGYFCAGGDIKDMSAARSARADSDPFFELNRCFGRLITRVNHAPQAVVAVLEGPVMGGGFGLACVSDIALAHEDAVFGLPETGLGIPPAQIAPFVVQRIGLTQARRLAVLGARFKGVEALRLGVVHEVFTGDDQLTEQLETLLGQIKRCAPHANEVTKDLMLSAQYEDLDSLLDRAARSFSECIQGEEGREGAAAFMQKRKPSWAVEEGS